MTPKERAAALVEAQGDELSRYQRMFLAQDIEKEITEAIDAECSRLRAALSDLLIGAEQQSQSHADVAAKCRKALGRINNLSSKCNKSRLYYIMHCATIPTSEANKLPKESNHHGSNIHTHHHQDRIHAEWCQPG